ncbi:MAG: GNAT family N-acetyltransferase [Ferruginibacter sp.]
MNPFSNEAISIADISDIPLIKQLLNSAYRGESSRQGWTTEADLIAGDVRTDENDLKQVMEKQGSIFLLIRSSETVLQACVNLQQHNNKIYLGMFAVQPYLQGKGLGKWILIAAEEYALSLACNAIYMSVIDARKELIAWYTRHGYLPTGDINTFVEDSLTGKHLQPLQFMILQKNLLDKDLSILSSIT